MTRYLLDPDLGDGVMTIKTKLQAVAAMAVACIALFSGCATKPSVNWVGCPVVSNDDQWSPSQAWLSSVEMGLRSDGVVVWRTRKPTR